MTCIESNHFPPKSGISEGPGLASSDSKQDIKQFYEAVMENLSFKVSFLNLIFRARTRSTAT